MSRNLGWKARGGGGGGRSSATAIRKGPKSSQATYQNVVDENEEIKTGIRELLLRLEPLVKVSGGNAPLESMMGYLEEIDDTR
jgi:hypothetical protein